MLRTECCYSQIPGDIHFNLFLLSHLLLLSLKSRNFHSSREFNAIKLLRYIYCSNTGESTLKNYLLYNNEETQDKNLQF